MTNRRRAIVVTAAVALGAGLGWRVLRELLGDPGTAPAGAPIGAATPGAEAALWALRLQRPEGGELVLESLRGRPLVVNFWATWCPPCVHELPEIDRFHADHAARGWQVVGIAVDSPTAVREFLARRPLRFPIGLAGLEGADLARQLGNSAGGLPFTVALDASGQVVRRKLGATNYAELASWAAPR
ncbi:MAG: TlpA family protein disulfide reductase [Rubrivivax sp.]